MTKSETKVGQPALKKRVVGSSGSGAVAVASKGSPRKGSAKKDLAHKRSKGAVGGMAQQNKTSNSNSNGRKSNAGNGRQYKSSGYSRGGRQKKAESQQLVDGWQEVLQKQYSRNPYPTSEDYDRLSNETGMERRLVPRWFINMRKGGVSKPYNDSGTSGRAAAPSPRRSKANHSIMKVEPELEKAFEEHTYPTPLQYQQIAERLGVEKKLVRRWFIGRRRLKANNESKLIADKAAADALALSKKPVASVSSLSSSTTPSPSPTAAQRARPADAATSKEAPVAVSAVVVPLQINGGGLRGASSDADAPGTDQPKVAPVVPVSPSTYSFTNSDGVTVSVVQAVGLDELDSKELAAIAGEDDGRLNGEYALASYVDDVELGEFVNGASAVSQVGSL